ncbi:MAG: glycosyltransferase family 4 protein [Promethearchaeota archaeon]
MKILWYINKQFDTSLDKSTWLEITRYLQKNNDVFLVSGFKREKIQFAELNNDIIYINSIKIPILNRIIFYYNQVRYFEKSLEDFKPEILLFNTQNFILLKRATKLKKKYRYKSFLDIRTLPVYSSKVKNSLEYFLFGKSIRIASEEFDGITYITKEIKRYCENKFRLPRHKSIIWTSGVNTDLFKPEDVKDKTKTFRIIYHGIITDNRGLENVIKAMDLLKDYDVELFLLGDGKGLSQLKKLTIRLKQEERVIFHPPIPYERVPEFINRANIGILPFPDLIAWNTSSPIKLFEYFACGLLVISTKIPSLYEILQGKNLVFWAESSEPVDIARAIKQAYDSRDRINVLGKKARELTIMNYTWIKQANKFEKFIKS